MDQKTFKKMPFGERRRLALKLFGEAQHRPQEVKKLLLHRRKLNFQGREIPSEFHGKVFSRNIPAHFLEPTTEKIPPPKATPDLPTWVGDEDGFRAMMTILQKTKFLTMDLEGENASYYGMTCLLQVGTWQQRFIVDPFPLSELLLTVFREFLERDDILVVMHSCANDLQWLHRDFSIFPTNIVDTQLVYQQMHKGNLIGYDEILQCLVPELHTSDGMKSICQLADWRKRPLDQRLIRYADMDVYGLLYVWEALKSNEDIKDYVYEAHEKLRAHLIRTFTKPVLDFAKELKSMRKNPNLSFEQEKNVRLLWEFRNFHAKAVDMEPSQLIKINCLVELVRKSPKNIDDVGKILMGNSDVLVKSYGTILKLLQESRQFLERIFLIQCNNCLRTGHAAFSCWEKFSSANINRYYNLHPELKKKRNKNKRANYKRNVAARNRAEN